MRNVARNIPVLFIIRICKWFMLYMPVVKLFYEENNLNNLELFQLHAVYSVIIALFEIPSGYAADIWGRKNSLVTGLAFGVLGFACYSFSYGFWAFLIAEVALGIGHGFISGADSALLYDSLQQVNRQNEYIKKEGYITGAGNFAEAFAGVAVTLLAFSSMRSYYYLQTMLSIVALMAGLFLVEPIVHRNLVHGGWKTISDTIKNSLLTNRKLRNYLLFSSIVGFASLIMAWFAQIFLYQAGVEASKFGVIWTGLNLLVAIGSIAAAWTFRKLGIRYSLWYILIFLSLGFIMASRSISIFGIVLLSVFYFVRGTAHPILKDQINSLTSSNVRATVLSIRSLIIRLLFSILGPFLGYITDKISLPTALLLCGIIVFFPGILLVIALIKVDKKPA